MDSRRIIKFGNSSYVVTLPFDWMKKNGLDKGSNVYFNETDEEIIIKASDKKKERTAVIELDDKPLKLLNKEIISYYLKNYDYIQINGKDIISKLEQIKVIKDKLSSVEIIEISKDKLILEDLTDVNNLDVCNLINDIIEMEKMIFDELSKINTENKHHLITSLDSNINKLTFLAYKAINNCLYEQKDKSEVTDVILYWRIVSSLEHMGDKMKRIARYLKERENTQEVHHIGLVIEDIKEYFTFITSLLNKDINLENNLRLYLDKKQSLLIEFEKLRGELNQELTLYLVITQLFKDLLGDIDNIVLSVLDIRYNQKNE